MAPSSILHSSRGAKTEGGRPQEALQLLAFVSRVLEGRGRKKKEGGEKKEVDWPISGGEAGRKKKRVGPWWARAGAKREKGKKGDKARFFVLSGLKKGSRIACAEVRWARGAKEEKGKGFRAPTAKKKLVHVALAHVGGGGREGKGEGAVPTSGVEEGKSSCHRLSSTFSTREKEKRGSRLFFGRERAGFCRDFSGVFVGRARKEKKKTNQPSVPHSCVVGGGKETLTLPFSISTKGGRKKRGKGK